MNSAIASEDKTVEETIYLPPCRNECPVKTDVQRYIFLISNRRYEEAFEVIRSVNPLPSTCSYICHHPCERSCRRGKIDDPLAIRHLKRFVTEKVNDYRISKRIPIKKTTEKKIAIIGSGPSGLTIASDLADLGYNITIFEKGDKLGGILATAIPLYRLPREALKEDIDDIVSKGMEVFTNCEIGSSITLNELVQRFDAIVIATGLSKSRSLNIPGFDGDGVILAIPFLIDAFSDKKIKIGKKVVVVGGGNVAMDVARTAKRMGSDVELVCLEDAHEMPAWPWEIKEAQDEDIKILHRLAPKSIVRANGILKGLEVMRVKSVFDDNKRFNPIYEYDNTSFIECDTVIVSIGQDMDTTFLKQSPLLLDNKGNLIFNRTTFMSNHPKIFFAGEIVTGPGSAITAIAHGHKVAHNIHLHLNGINIEQPNDFYKGYETIGDIPDVVSNNIPTRARVSINLLDTNNRKKTFKPIQIGYDETSALKESKRCRGCGGGAVVDIKKCMACLTCKRVCPYDAPLVSSYSKIRQEYCQACGLCVSTCPGKAIYMRGYDIQYIRDNVHSALSSAVSYDKPSFLVFSCISSDIFPDLQSRKDIKLVHLDCLSRIDILDIITPFYYKIAGVLLMACDEEDCKYKMVDQWLRLKIIQAKTILSSMSIDPNKVCLLFKNNHVELQGFFQELVTSTNSNAY